MQGIAAMDRIVAQISHVLDWEYLIALESSLTAQGLMNEKVRAELDRHGLTLARRYLIKKARLGNGPFSVVEEEILDVLAAGVATLRRAGQLPHDVIKGIRAGGLVGMVQRRVSHPGDASGRSDWQMFGTARGDFEGIVNRHPAAFDAETVKLARFHAV